MSQIEILASKATNYNENEIAKIAATSRAANSIVEAVKLAPEIAQQDLIDFIVEIAKRRLSNS